MNKVVYFTNRDLETQEGEVVCDSLQGLLNLEPRMIDELVLDIDFLLSQELSSYKLERMMQDAGFIVNSQFKLSLTPSNGADLYFLSNDGKELDTSLRDRSSRKMHLNFITGRNRNIGGRCLEHLLTLYPNDGTKIALTYDFEQHEDNSSTCKLFLGSLREVHDYLEQHAHIDYLELSSVSIGDEVNTAESKPDTRGSFFTSPVGSPSLSASSDEGVPVSNGLPSGGSSISTDFRKRD